jgi:hypothetical protein
LRPLVRIDAATHAETDEPNIRPEQGKKVIDNGCNPVISTEPLVQ